MPLIRKDSFQVIEKTYEEYLYKIIAVNSSYVVGFATFLIAVGVIYSVYNHENNKETKLNKNTLEIPTESTAQTSISEAK